MQHQIMSKRQLKLKEKKSDVPKKKWNTGYRVCHVDEHWVQSTNDRLLLKT